MSYKDQRGGGDGLDTIPGFSVKQKGQPHDTFSPTFKDGHVLTFRPFPEVLKDGTEAEWRTGPNEFEFGNQMCAVKMVRYWGANDKFTFICTLPDSEGGQEAASPAEMFYRAIKRAVDQKDPLYPMHWYEWFAGGQNQGEALSAPKIHLMLQGAVLQDGPKQYVDPSTGQASPKMPAILMLPVSARMEIERKMNEEVKGYQGSFKTTRISFRWVTFSAVPVATPSAYTKPHRPRTLGLTMRWFPPRQ